MADLSFLDEDTLRAVEAYAMANGCTKVEALNALVTRADRSANSARVAAASHLAQHKALGLKDDDTGAEVA